MRLLSQAASCTWPRWVFPPKSVGCVDYYCHWFWMFVAVLLTCVPVPYLFQWTWCQVWPWLSCEWMFNWTLKIPWSALHPFSYTVLKLIKNVCLKPYIAFEIEKIRTLILLYVFNFYAIFIFTFFCFSTHKISIISKCDINRGLFRLIFLQIVLYNSKYSNILIISL